MSLWRLTRRAPFIWFRTFAVGARAGAAAPLEPSRIIHRPPQLPMPLRRLLLQDDAPPLLGVLLERVLEGEGVAAVRAAVLHLETNSKGKNCLEIYLENCLEN